MIGDVLEAYERLILDAMRGDRTLFTTAEGIERLWEVSTPLLESPPPASPTCRSTTPHALGPDNCWSTHDEQTGNPTLAFNPVHRRASTGGGKILAMRRVA